MASTFSPSLRIELIGNGEQSGTWGSTTNTNLGTLVEQAITGVQTITMSNAPYTLTALNGASDESRNAVLVVQGTNSAIQNIIAPAREKTYIIYNNTIGGFAIRIKTAASTGVLIPSGGVGIVYCDGSEFFLAAAPQVTANVANTAVLRDASGNFSAGTITANLNGNLTGAAPTAPTAAPGTNTTQIATTAFVQAALQALYPIGTIYISVVSTNPNTLFGFGTWVAFGTGRTLVGIDSGDASFDVVEETGGSKNAIVVSHTHTATVTDLGHNHGINDISGSGSGFAGIDGISRSLEGVRTDVIARATTGITVTNSSTGISGTNANLPPYIVVHMWKRTA